MNSDIKQTIQSKTDHEKIIEARNSSRKEILDKMTSPEIKWLTDNSRKFLESGYLTEGVTPEGRIREIAENAEKILNKPGFADKFENYMAEGFYSLASCTYYAVVRKNGRCS